VRASRGTSRLQPEARAEILRLAQGQSDTLATSFADLLGDGGPSDETADEMIRAIREWRDTPSNGSGAVWLETGEALQFCAAGSRNCISTRQTGVSTGKLIFDKRNEYLWQLP